ncbi:MAG: type II toxin-antitoxin system death-on-curing family toxin [Devosia sp.]
MANVYLSIADLLYIHDEQLRLYGGAAGTRDEGLLLSALARPMGGCYADLVEEAAALWESLAMNHGFVDGNKRVAFAGTLVFLHVNGLQLVAGQDETIAFIYSHLEAGTLNKDVLDAWLRQNTKPL